MEPNTKKRNSSIELLRILCIFGILLMHTYSVRDSSNSTLLNDSIGMLIGTICNTGVSCFVLISGFYGLNFKKRRFVEIIILTTVYSLIVSLIGNGFSGYHIFKALLAIPFYNTHWFISCYLVLMVLSPYIEVVIQGIDKIQYAKLLIFLFIVLSVIPIFLNVGYDSAIINRYGKNLSYFIFLYLVGRYIQFYWHKRLPLLTIWGGHFLMTVLIIALNVSGTVIFGKKCVIFALDCSPFILVSSICIFLIFQSFQYYVGVINVIAKSVLGVYVMNSLSVYFGQHYFTLSKYSSDALFPVMVLGVVFVTFVSCVIIDNVIRKVYYVVEPQLIRAIDRFTI